MSLLDVFRARPPVEETPNTPADVLERIERLEKRWLTWKVEADDFLEAVAKVLEGIEHKRRQITSAAARAKTRREAPEEAPSEEQEPQPSLPLDRNAQKSLVRALARRNGYVQ